MKIKTAFSLLIGALFLITSCKTSGDDPAPKKPKDGNSISITIEGEVDEREEARYLHLETGARDEENRVKRITARFDPNEEVPAIAYVYNDTTGYYAVANITLKAGERVGTRLSFKGDIAVDSTKYYNKLSIYIGLKQEAGKTVEEAVFHCGKYSYNQVSKEVNKEVIFASEGNDLQKVPGRGSDLSASNIKFKLSGTFFMASIHNVSGAKQTIGGIKLHGFGAGGVKVDPPTPKHTAPRLVAIQQGNQDCTNYDLQSLFEIGHNATAQHTDTGVDKPFVLRFAVYAPVPGHGWLEAQQVQNKQFVPLESAQMRLRTPKAQSKSGIFFNTTLVLEPK